MSLKRRIEQLEELAGRGDQMVEIELGDGRTARITRTQLRAILDEIAGSDTGPGPAKSRRALVEGDS